MPTMTCMRWKPILAAVLLATTGLAIAQTSEEEDMNFAVSTLGLKMQKIAQGDYTDRSGEFPKNAYGEIAKGMYGIARRTTLRSLDTDARLAQTKLEVIAGLEWAHSPKAALREIAKATEIFSVAKIAFRKDLKTGEALFEASDQDTTNMRIFKAGLRSGYSQRIEAGAGKDYYTAFLVLLSKLEDVYQHIDLHRREISVVVGPVVVFGKPALNLAFEQKVDAADKAAQAVETLIAQQNQRFIDGVKQMRGGTGSNG
jgi:hypothetical protein